MLHPRLKSPGLLALRIPPTRRGTLLPVGRSTGEEYPNLYTLGVNEGYNGDPLEAQALLDVLDVFGEDGLRMYLVGVLEREVDAAEEEAAADPDAVDVIVDYETGEVTPIERADEDEEDFLEGPDSEEDGPENRDGGERQNE
jgi:hypothetical protein